MVGISKNMSTAITDFQETLSSLQTMVAKMNVSIDDTCKVTFSDTVSVSLDPEVATKMTYYVYADITYSRHLHKLLKSLGSVDLMISLFTKLFMSGSMRSFKPLLLSFTPETIKMIKVSVKESFKKSMPNVHKILTNNIIEQELIDELRKWNPKSDLKLVQKLLKIASLVPTTSSAAIVTMLVPEIHVILGPTMLDLII